MGAQATRVTRSRDSGAWEGSSPVRVMPLERGVGRIPAKAVPDVRRKSEMLQWNAKILIVLAALLSLAVLLGQGGWALNFTW
jgi:hypothetical protein